MKKSKAAALVILVLLASAGFYYAFSSLSLAKSAVEKKQSPPSDQTPQIKEAQPAELPDYTKPPFVFAAEGKKIPYLKSGLGSLYTKLYTNDTSKEVRPGIQDIFVYYKNDEIVYAEWYMVDDKDIKKEAIRGYSYIDGKFIFEDGMTTY